jgi:ADP-heptose:LPS heptosyltransferase
VALATPQAPRVLVLRALGLGDLLTAVPALRSVREALPGHRVVLAAPPLLAPLARLIDAVDDVLPARGLAPIECDSPDVAVNLHGRGPESHRLLQSLNPGTLVAFGCQLADHDGLPWVEEEHEVMRWCRLVETVLDVASDPGLLDLAVPDIDQPEVVVVHPGAAFPSRRWPAQRFAAVCRTLDHLGQRVVVTGSNSESG